MLTYYHSSELKASRKKAGWTQAELAEKAGFARGAVIYWEKRTGIIKSVAVERFAEALNNAGYEIEPAGLRTKPRPLSLAEIHFFQPQLKREHSLCGAKTRKGYPCKARAIKGTRRCRNHGGMSTGAKTADGIERIREAQMKRWAKYREERANE